MKSNVQATGHILDHIVQTLTDLFPAHPTLMFISKKSIPNQSVQTINGVARENSRRLSDQSEIPPIFWQ